MSNLRVDSRMEKSGNVFCRDQWKPPSTNGEGETNRIREGAEWRGKCSASHWICPWDSAWCCLRVQCLPHRGWRVRLSSPWGPHVELPVVNNPSSELMPVASHPPWWAYFLGSGKAYKWEGVQTWWQAADHSLPSPATSSSAQSISLSESQGKGSMTDCDVICVFILSSAIHFKNLSY